MSEPKHTPGPWKANHSKIVGRFGPQDIHYDCSVAIIDYRNGRCVYNQALIIAAPCLLARLESLAAQHACGCGHPACKRCADDKLNQEVIERAKGGAE